MNLSKIKPSGVIHIFALLHAAVTILCLEARIGDELFLTVLTMAMILLVCLKKNLNLEFTAGIIIIINVTGYLLGTAGANLIGMIFSSDLAVHAISTAFTTELLGWSTILVGNILNRLRLFSGSIRMPHMPWLIAVVLAIFLFRLAIIALSDMNILSNGGLYKNLVRLMYNIPVCIILICLNIIYVRFARTRLRQKPAYLRWTALTSFVVLVVLSATFAVGIDLPFSIQQLPPVHDLVETSVVVFIAEILFYVLIYMADYVRVTHQDVKAEKMKRHKAQFEYLKLKQQVNPHFLFNMLNNANVLIKRNPEEASKVLFKLEDLLRYQINDSSRERVSLASDIRFLNDYLNLEKIRRDHFQFTVEQEGDIDSIWIQPLLFIPFVENAVKHSFDSEHPSSVHLSFKVEENRLEFRCENSTPAVAVSNKVGGIGLANIQRRLGLLYPDRYELEQIENENRYIVILCITL